MNTTTAPQEVTASIQPEMPTAEKMIQMFATAPGSVLQSMEAIREAFIAAMPDVSALEARAVKAESACAAMRAYLTEVVAGCDSCRGKGEISYTSDPQGGPHPCGGCKEARELLEDTDAGKDFVPLAEREVAQVALVRACEVFDCRPSDLAWRCRETAKERDVLKAENADLVIESGKRLGWLNAKTDECQKLKAGLLATQKYLKDVNRGAELNAHTIRVVTKEKIAMLAELASAQAALKSVGWVNATASRITLATVGFPSLGVHAMVSTIIKEEMAQPPANERAKSEPSTSAQPPTETPIQDATVKPWSFENRPHWPVWVYKKGFISDRLITAWKDDRVEIGNYAAPSYEELLQDWVCSSSAPCGHTPTPLPINPTNPLTNVPPPAKSEEKPDPLAEVKAAFARGETIECSAQGEVWRPCVSPAHAWPECWQYRIKPAPAFVSRFKVGDRVIVKMHGATDEVDGILEADGEPCYELKTWGTRYENQLEPYVKPKPAWTLPAPPEGQQWHRSDGWQEEWLSDGWRPLLMGEDTAGGDEHNGFGVWRRAANPISLTEKQRTKIHFRTRRALPQPAPPQDAERAKFESEFSGCNFNRNEIGCYANLMTQHRWEGWQASLASRNQPEPCATTPTS